jgi:hypothetical protein
MEISWHKACTRAGVLNAINALQLMPTMQEQAPAETVTRMAGSHERTIGVSRHVDPALSVTPQAALF